MNRGPALPDTLGPIVLQLAGLLLVVLAWFGANGESAVAPQFVYLNLGIGGVVLAGTGNAIYLLGMRRAVRRRQADVLAHRQMRDPEGLDR